MAGVIFVITTSKDQYVKIVAGVRFVNITREGLHVMIMVEGKFVSTTSKIKMSFLWWKPAL